MRLLLVLLIISLAVLNAVPAQAEGDIVPCLEENAPGCTDGLPNDVYTQLLPQMQANPVPLLEPITVNMEQVNRYSGFFRIAPNSEIYDAPNGNVIGNSGDGFNFIGSYGVKDGFMKKRDGTWVKLTALKRTSASILSGVMMNKPMPFPVAWIIKATIPSKVPGGSRHLSTPAMKRYTMVNIFATVQVDGWNWSLVGSGQWIIQKELAHIKPAPRPQGAEKWVSVDLYEQVLTAYEGDTMVYATLISTGLAESHTNLGTFQVWRRVETTPMTGAMGEAISWSLPSVPYVMFFDNDISLHGTYWHDGFGFPRSRGCVNLTITDAEWLYNWVGDSGKLTVHVWDSAGRTQE